MTPVEKLTRLSVLTPFVLVLVGAIFFAFLLYKASGIVANQGQRQARTTVQQLGAMASDVIQQRIFLEMRSGNLKTRPETDVIQQHANAAAQNFPGHIILLESEGALVQFSTLTQQQLDSTFSGILKNRARKFFKLESSFGTYLAYQNPLVFAERSPTLDAVFLVRQDLLMAPYQALTSQMKLFTVVGLFIFALVGWFIGKFIGVRFEAVRAVVLTAEEGEKPEPLNTLGSYEFKRLAEALNLLIQGPTAKDKVRQEANTDPLTGLLNRRGFIQSMDEKFSAGGHAAEMSVMFLDLDGFKPVNDTYGHEVGDDILKEVAARLNGCVRENDVVCRLGGDEFVLLFPTLTDRTVLEKRADRVLAKINEPYWVEDNRVTMGVSIGISIGPADGKTGEELLTAADEAMYSAKKTGKNQFTFYS